MKNNSIFALSQRECYTRMRRHIWLLNSNWLCRFTYGLGVSWQTQSQWKQANSIHLQTWGPAETMIKEKKTPSQTLSQYSYWQDLPSVLCRWTGVARLNDWGKSLVNDWPMCVNSSALQCCDWQILWLRDYTINIHVHTIQCMTLTCTIAWLHFNQCSVMPGLYCNFGQHVYCVTTPHLNPLVSSEYGF